MVTPTEGMWVNLRIGRVEPGIKDPEDKVNHGSRRVLATYTSEHELMNRSLKTRVESRFQIN